MENMMKVTVIYECDYEELFDVEYVDYEDEDFEDEDDGIEYDEDGVAWWFDEDEEIWYFYDEDEDDWFEWDEEAEEEDAEYYVFEEVTK
jgi:hypothetical protein